LFFLSRISNHRLFHPLDAECTEVVSRRQWFRRRSWVALGEGGEGAQGWQLKVDDCLVYDDRHEFNSEPGAQVQQAEAEEAVEPKRPCYERRHLPCKVTRLLRLCPEEALFMCDELKCLEVVEEFPSTRDNKNVEKRLLTSVELWSRFGGAEDDDFLSRFVFN
jgi:hypothetical protein